jgi:cardiolipin synthase
MSRQILLNKRHNQGQRFTYRNSLEWLQSGRNYFDQIVGLIDSARYEIHLQTYIFASDHTGTEVAEALMRAAKRKVEVFVLTDAYGSQNLSGELIFKMRSAGISLRKYGRLYSRGRFHIGRRLHQKVLVIDGHTSVVGGINMSDHYNEMPDKPAWLDFAVIIRGNASRRLLYLCRRRWMGWQFRRISGKKLMKMNHEHFEFTGNSAVKVRRNDFIKNRNEIAISYRNAFRYATTSILLVGGYFLPGGRTRRIMRKAIERGVQIDVLVPEKSDVGMVTLARRYLYDWLMRNGVGVYEYRPSNVHGKVIITDNKWTSIGSYDLNNLSTYSNIELNVDIHDGEFSVSLSSHIRKIMKKDCVKVTARNPYRRTTLFSKLLSWISYRLVKTLFILSVLLAGKREREF